MNSHFLNRDQSGDWPEDFAHENGNYFSKCCLCKKDFKGHKRRPICKRCDCKIARRMAFKGISIEQKWKSKHENETYEGNKSGGQFMRTVIDYKGQNR